MKKQKRVLLKAYVKPEIQERVMTQAKRTGMSASRIVERLLESGKYPDLTSEKAVLRFLQVNHDQARLGNLLIKAMNEIADGRAVAQLQTLLHDVRHTQTQIKALVAELNP